jgi:hypothetical protein
MAPLVAFLFPLVAQGIVVKHHAELQEQMSLPPQNCLDCGGGPPDPTPSSTPKPWTTSTPDFQVQLKLGLCLDANVTGVILSTIKKSLPSADVVFAPCTSDHKIGIWRSAPKAPDNSAARLNGAKAINLIIGSETFAFFATANGYQKGVDAAWNSIPHRFNDNFEPSSSGDITLDYNELIFSSLLKKISLKIYGSAPAGITFTVTSADTLSIDSDKHIACSNSNSLVISKPVVDAATVLSFVFAPFLSPWLLDVEQKFANAQNSVLPIPESVKCVLASMIPSVIPVCCTFGLVGKKLDFQYSRLDVGSFGVKVGGKLIIADRIPKVHIFIHCIPDENATDISYKVTASTEDLVPPVTRKWKHNGVSIPLPSKFVWKTNTQHTLELTATDVDNLVGVGHVTVTAKYCPTPKGSGPSDTVCNKKPWTPGCDEAP